LSAFNEQLVILQRTATTSQVIERGAKTVERTQHIDSGMPPFDGPLSWPKAFVGSMRNWLQRKTQPRCPF
jgi:hypothetical protein